MKNQKQLILLSAFLLISLYSFSQATPNLANANTWLGTLWTSLKPVFITILGIVGGYFLVMVAIMYAKESEDEKKKNKYMMGGLVLAGAATVLALV
jgi:hypothetical protein